MFCRNFNDLLDFSNIAVNPIKAYLKHQPLLNFFEYTGTLKIKFFWITYILLLSFENDDLY